ncbi:MAG: polysaccharide deacetylase family protein [Candidatus Eremiobacteraeota bacterium]|nr:polysaccharide deacetylase family protein [Candidatus Eremiobacteraeota bacterium]
MQSPSNTFFGPTITGVVPGRRIVALTFDDGPNLPVTARILDVLRDERAPATFFVVGRAAARHPEILGRMDREGHAIGNHTWGHVHLNIRSRAAIGRELEATDDAIEAATGVRPKLARPPFGARSFLVLDELKRRGYACVLWSVPLAREWDGPAPQEIAHRVLDGARDGSIIVLHDGDRGRTAPASRAGTIEATRLIVRGLRERGLRLVTVSEMLAG